MATLVLSRTTVVVAVLVLFVSGLANTRVVQANETDVAEPLVQPRAADGDGSVKVTGELKQWHKVTVTLNGPFAHEQDTAPNPFVDYRMTVQFRHADGTVYEVPGYFAADGDAANSSANSGNRWRAHFSPDRVGKWTFTVSFLRGKSAAIDPSAPATLLDQFSGASRTLSVNESNKMGRDFRRHGRLQYVGQRYLQFAGSKQFFLKAGADAPETLLAYADFDGTTSMKPQKAPIKTWQPHVADWRWPAPSWKNGKGKGLIGAVNYLSSKGCNAFSFLTYNAGGDGDNVWPFTGRDDKLHYDCSKLDQWGIVFDHATSRGMYLHFKLQETENDDNTNKAVDRVPESLDGGDLGVQRKVYLKELVARFGHNLALNWNLGEENTQSTAQQQAMINYLREVDCYGHHIVVHTYPDQQEKVYDPLLGKRSQLTGVSLQNSGIQDTHRDTLKWVRRSAEAGRPWVVAFDESGSAAHGQCPDLGYRGFDGRDNSGMLVYTQHEVRRLTLWGTLMAGGAGVEYYFGYQFAENDLICEDWRSRDESWGYCRIALDFFHDNRIPFWRMSSANSLVGNPTNTNAKYCFAKPNDTYLVYLPLGGTSQLDLSDATGWLDISWFNPRTGGDLLESNITEVKGGSMIHVGAPPEDVREDWVVLVRRRAA